MSNYNFYRSLILYDFSTGFFPWQFKSIWINMSLITVFWEIVIVFTAMFVDGEWSSWTNYSSCSVSMGHGVRHRTRNCNNPKPCGLLAEPCQGTNYTEIECEGFSHFTLKFRYQYLWFAFMPFYLTMQHCIENTIAVFLTPFRISTLSPRFGVWRELQHNRRPVGFIFLGQHRDLSQNYYCLLASQTFTNMDIVHSWRSIQYGDFNGKHYTISVSNPPRGIPPGAISFIRHQVLL